MTKIYDQHVAAFQYVSAYVLMNDGEQIGKIAFKFPKDGAGRLYCYFHLIGSEMTRGYAGGYGYDKKSAAICDAIEKLPAYKHSLNLDNYSEQTKKYWEEHEKTVNMNIDKIKVMFADIGGTDWADVFRKNNIQVLNAV